MAIEPMVLAMFRTSATGIPGIPDGAAFVRISVNECELDQLLVIPPGERLIIEPVPGGAVARIEPR